MSSPEHKRQADLFSAHLQQIIPRSQERFIRDNDGHDVTNGHRYDLFADMPSTELPGFTCLPEYEVLGTQFGPGSGLQGEAWTNAEIQSMNPQKWQQKIAELEMAAGSHGRAPCFPEILDFDEEESPSKHSQLKKFKKFDNMSKEKNRAAQKRFREKQRAKVEELESKLKEAEAAKQSTEKKMNNLLRQNSHLSQQMIAYQAEKAELHLGEMSISEPGSSGASQQSRRTSREGSGGSKDSLHKDRHRDQAVVASQQLMDQLLTLISPTDFDASDPALTLLLESGSSLDCPDVDPGLLKITLHKHSQGSNAPSVYQLSDLMRMRHETFMALYNLYAESLCNICKRYGMASLSEPYTRKIATELRALMCIFCALHPSMSTRHQLQNCKSWTVVDESEDRETLQKLMSVLQLSDAQVIALRQACLVFKSQQTQLQLKRMPLLPVLQGSLYSTSSVSASEPARMLQAAQSLKENLEADHRSVSRLTSQFLTRILTVEQYAQLVAAAFPHCLNVMGFIQKWSNAAPVSGPSTPDRKLGFP